MPENLLIHQAAEEFPMLDDKRLKELGIDIGKNGLREPLRLFEGQILDGRNRYKACFELGIKPDVVNLPDDIDPYAYVWSLNGERRDLTEAQRYGIWKRCHEKSEGWQAEQQRLKEEADKKRSEATKKQPRSDDGSRVAKKTGVATGSGTTSKPKQKPKRSSTAKATASGTNRGTVERMDRIEKADSELYDKVVAGETTEAAATREVKRVEVVARLEDIEAQEIKAIEGVYDVIVIDPPWPMKKIDRDVRPNQTEFDYPTLSEEELEEVYIPTADNCHVFVWTTHRFLPQAFRLLKSWGFKYVCCMTWHKPGGYQPVGLPQFNSEFCLYARKGTPVFIDTKAFPVCFNAPRGKHSEKPEEFYAVLRRVTAGRRLDMYNRRQIEGFDGSGNESK